MAKIIINAKITKISKEYSAGIAFSTKGDRGMGIVDDRRVTYKDQTIFYSGIQWNKNKRILSLVEESKNSSTNIGIFVSTYENVLVDGKMLIHEELDFTNEVTSVSFKQEIGGYKEDSPDVVKISDTLYEVKPKQTKMFLTVGTAKEKLVIKNREGFYFVCDFKKNNWFTLKPGSSKIEIYDYDNNIGINDLLKEKLPFPCLDRKIFDGDYSSISLENLDIKKHAIRYV